MAESKYRKVIHRFINRYVDKCGLPVGQLGHLSTGLYTGLGIK